jgi:hypothetical protein
MRMFACSFLASNFFPCVLDVEQNRWSAGLSRRVTGENNYDSLRIGRPGSMHYERYGFFRTVTRSFQLSKRRQTGEIVFRGAPFSY